MSFIDTDDAFSVAAKRIANSVRRSNADLQLPVQSQPQPTTYIIEPDLMETQTGNMHLPQDVAFDDVGNPYNTITGKPVKVVRRPNVLPIAKTPEGFTFAMPKMLDIAGNVMSPLAAGRVPVKAGEVVLGSGAVRTVPEVSKEIQPFYSGLEQTVANAKVNKADAAQWLGYLKNQPGVKSEELGYVLNNLPEGQITREGLQDIIKNNKVELKEVVKGKQPIVTKANLEEPNILEVYHPDDPTGEVNGMWGEIIKKDNKFTVNVPELPKKTFNTQADAEKFISDNSNLGSNTKYHDYQLPGGPLSRDTEILTKEGWKRIDSVTIGEEIITRKDEDGELEWQPILAIPSVYSEKLYHFYNQSIDMQVTANHKMVVRKRRRSSRGIFRITAQELWTTSECVVPLTGNWKGIGSKTLFGYDACDAAEFIGWYLSEGSYKHKNGVKNTIQIYQCRNHNPENCDRLEALFDRMGVTWRYYGNGYGIGSKSINKSLLELLHNQPTSEGKFIPPLFFNENKHVINSLLDGLILGDGHYSEEGYDDYGSLRQARKIFFSKSKSLADGVQILALLSGYRASVRKRPTGIYCVGINLKEWNSVDDSKYAIVDYHDFAFCVTVKNHCIYVRRNGVAAFTGNSDYQEMLLTLPVKTSPKAQEAFDLTKRMNNGEFNSLDDKARKELFAKRDKLLQEAKLEEGSNYKSSHWDEPNILAHVRYNDRDIPDVGKSLHLEEIQSDWHQAGRKQGYKNNLSENEKLELKSLKIKKDNGSMNGDEAVRLGELSNKEAAYGGVPDAPFKKNWDELAFKRMLHKAAVEGYDSVSWTPGEAQAARYDLSKQVDRIKVDKNDAGGNIVRIEPKSGDKINLQVDEAGKVIASFPSSQAGQFEGKHISDIVGKELAEKIVKDANEGSKVWGVKNKKSGNWSERFATKEEAAAYQEKLPESIRASTEVLEMVPKTSKEYSGLDLKIGGEGMKSFYDKMLVDKANALAKKYGAKVESKNIETKYGTYKVQGPMQPSGDYIVAKDGTQHRFKTFKEAEAFRNSLNQQPVHVLKLTPELRAKAKSGFPLFSSTPITTPVDYDPFQTNKKYRLVPIQGNPFND